MRYYFGYTSANPKAHPSLRAGGLTPDVQHTEYSLGTVDITDNTFNLYVNDADRLGGTYDIFGWAWVRLAPAEPAALHQISPSIYLITATRIPI